MTDLRELEKRLEEATVGSEGLNIEILHVLHDHGGFAREMFVVPNFTASLDAAVALVERVLPGWGWVSGGGGEYRGAGDATLLCKDTSQPDILRAKAATPALALCLALIRALIAKGDRHD